MKHLVLVLLLSAAGMAQQWTLYYSETSTGHSDGSVTVSPTVAITGNDGGYCSPFNGEQGDETPAVMLNGNAWAIGPAIGSGDLDGNPNDINFAHTFPNVTLPANHARVDLSYAAKVHVVCFVLDEETFTPPYSLSSFYQDEFLDGYGPNIYPAPCTMGLNCAMPWPALWHSVPIHGIQHNLVSMVASSWVQTYDTFYGPPVTVVGGLCKWGSVQCSNEITPTCFGGYASGPSPPNCPQYIKTVYVLFEGQCIPIVNLETAGPGPCD